MRISVSFTGLYHGQNWDSENEALIENFSINSCCVGCHLIVHVNSNEYSQQTYRYCLKFRARWGGGGGGGGVTPYI